jgi:hypothetical protein
MATPIVDAPATNSFNIPWSQSGTTKLSAVKSGGVAVDFTAGSWLFDLYVRPSNPALFRDPLALSSGYTITGDAAGVLTIAWTTAGSNDQNLNSTRMSYSLQMSNDAHATRQVAAQGQINISNVV